MAKVAQVGIESLRRGPDPRFTSVQSLHGHEILFDDGGEASSEVTSGEHEALWETGDSFGRKSELCQCVNNDVVRQLGDGFDKAITFHDKAVAFIKGQSPITGIGPDDSHRLLTTLG